MKPSASPRLLVGAALTVTILLTWSTWFGAAIALPFGHGLPSAVVHASGAGIGALLVLGLVLSTVPFLLWAWVLARLPNVASSALLMIGPSGVLLGWVCLGEQPAPLALAGVATVVVRGPRKRLPVLVRTPAPQHA